MNHTMASYPDLSSLLRYLSYTGTTRTRLECMDMITRGFHDRRSCIGLFLITLHRVGDELDDAKSENTD